MRAIRIIRGSELVKWKGGFCIRGGVLVIFWLFPAGTVFLDLFVCFGELVVSSFFFSFFALPIIDGAVGAFLICFLSVLTARVDYPRLWSFYFLHLLPLLDFSFAGVRGGWAADEASCVIPLVLWFALCYDIGGLLSGCCGRCGMGGRWMMDEINEEGKRSERGCFGFPCQRGLFVLLLKIIYHCPFRCALLRSLG